MREELAKWELGILIRQQMELYSIYNRDLDSSTHRRIRQLRDFLDSLGEIQEVIPEEELSRVRKEFRDSVIKDLK